VVFDLVLLQADLLQQGIVQHLAEVIVVVTVVVDLLVAAADDQVLADVDHHLVVTEAVTVVVDLLVVVADGQVLADVDHHLVVVDQAVADSLLSRVINNTCLLRQMIRVNSSLLPMK